MPQDKSPAGRVTATVADLTGRSDQEVRLLLGVAAAGVAVAGTIRAVEVLVDLGASFARRASRSAK